MHSKSKSMKYNLVLVTLDKTQIEKAKQANGERKRITHALVCGPYGQMFGTEKQCFKYYSAWVNLFSCLFDKGVKTDAFVINDFKTTDLLVCKLFDAEDALNETF